MSTVTFTEEFSSPIAAPRLFKALIVDGDNLIPKIAPQAIKNVEILEGNGGPGTIKKINFAEDAKTLHIFGSYSKRSPHPSPNTPNKALIFPFMGCLSGDDSARRIGDEVPLKLRLEEVEGGGDLVVDFGDPGALVGDGVAAERLLP